MMSGPRPLPAPIALIAALIAALALSLVLGGCAGLVKPWVAPEVGLLGVGVKELRVDRQTLTLRLEVRNPNDRTLPVKAMTYRLRLEGQEVAQGGGALDRQIPAFGATEVDVDVTASVLGLMGRLPALARANDPLDWQISGTVTLVGGLVTLPYRYSGQIEPRALMVGGALAR